MDKQTRIERQRERQAWMDGWVNVSMHECLDGWLGRREVDLIRR
jgi:hypothetical protein